ncbi:HAMP domain-containing methyl-accepting chemotaxis protein [Clostridium cylindrosporum]|uniref:Methyl-accepting chemotaxis protein n=1 Tax=Clostridium cylindrosporum DSM 605 TaxID=1121307 RepID=A0A0J8DG64_CLOCY|nr:HAMP domain-containing methyl-accepting chemotaxis protein [Clostridium cylindrosporum]KMT23229.1 methyl-accepting chemotaxis protein [Clostridium cylindrosporum DSM 605]
MKFKIGVKLGVGFGAILVIFLFLGINNMFKFNSVKSAQDDIMKNQYPSSKSLMEMQINTSNCRRVLYQHILTTDNMQSLRYEEVLNKYIEKVNENMKTYEPTISSGEEKSYYDEFKKNWDLYLEVSNQAMVMSKANKDIEAQTIANKSQEYYDASRVALEKNVDLNNAYMLQGQKRADESINSAKMQIIIYLTMALLFALVFAIYITKNIVTSTNKVLSIISSIANGDLTKEVNIKTNDEIRMIGDSTNSLIISLKDMLEKIIHVANKVTYTSEELNATCEENSSANFEITQTISELALGSLDQSKSINEVNIIMKNMSDSIKNISQRIESIGDSSNMVENATINGVIEADNAVSKIGEIKNVTQQMAYVINKLRKESNKIGEIIEVIKNISRQTNLLALNAAIEAARAGEHGKGFSIVAEEVRKLAEESSNSAEEITVLIESIQNETKTVVEVMSKGAMEVENGVKAVDDTSKAFKTISSEIHRVVEQVSNVAMISQEILKDSEKVVDSIESVNIIAENSAAATEEVSASAQEQNSSIESLVYEAHTLAELGGELQILVSKFKI